MTSYHRQVSSQSSRVLLWTKIKASMSTNNSDTLQVRRTKVLRITKVLLHRCGLVKVKTQWPTDWMGKRMKLFSRQLLWTSPLLHTIEIQVHWLASRLASTLAMMNRASRINTSSPRWNWMAPRTKNFSTLMKGKYQRSYSMHIDFSFLKPPSL